MTGRGSALEAFERDGVVRVPAVVARDEVAAMRESLWATLAAHRIVDERLVELVGALRPGPGTDNSLWEVGRQAAFAPLAAALGRAADEVFGAGVWAPIEGQQGGLAAPNFPIPGVWSVPHQAWHVDEPTGAGRAAPWGLLGFVLLDEVEPGGGGTVMIAGSHRRLLSLAAAHGTPGGLLTTEEAIAALSAAEPWFAACSGPAIPPSGSGASSSTVTSRWTSRCASSSSRARRATSSSWIRAVCTPSGPTSRAARGCTCGWSARVRSDATRRSASEVTGCARVTAGQVDTRPSTGPGSAGTEAGDQATPSAETNQRRSPGHLPAR